MPKKPRYYWDSGLFIALLTGEQRAPGEMEGLLEVIHMADVDEAFIVTSHQSTIEVLGPADAPLTDAFLEIFERPNYRLLPAVLPISRRAADYRRDLSLKFADAIHLATAVLYGVDELHSFDRDLLRLDRHPRIDGLHICKPSAPQKTLAL